jgi:hypothetical protein
LLSRKAWSTLRDVTRFRREGRSILGRLAGRLGLVLSVVCAVSACSLTSDLGALECGAACDPDAHAPESDASADGGLAEDTSAPSADSGALADSSTNTSDGGQKPGITCGVAGTCDPATDVCCATPFIASCSSASSCKGTAIECDDAFDCASGQICCGTVNGPQLTAVACTASCTDGNNVTFCDPNASTCPAGTSCKTAHFASDLLGNLVSAYSTCQ